MTAQKDTVEEEVAIAQLNGWSPLGECACGATALSDGATNICTRTGEESEYCDDQKDQDLGVGRGD